MIDCFLKELNRDEKLSQYNIDIKIDSSKVIYLSGEVDRWQEVVDIGHIAGRLPGIKGVVNRIISKDYREHRINNGKKIQQGKKFGVIAAADVAIIGSGICGASIARTLSKYNQRIVVIEKNSDISEGTSKANNGMIHPGHDPKFGSLKAKCNVKGNAMYTRWAKELKFHLTRPGQLIIAFCDEDEKKLINFYENALKNQVPGVQILSEEEAKSIEPMIGVKFTKALWLPTAGFVEPYEVVEALMENAIDNGVQLMLKTEVVDIEVGNYAVKSVITNKGVITANCIINAAGMHADDIAEMVGDRFYTIHPRRGSLFVFDQNAGDKSVNVNISTLPSAYTKGGGNMQTPAGNPLWGPSAKEVPEKDDLSVEEEDFTTVINKALTKGVTEKDIITYFSGIRAANYIEDFIIEPSEKIQGFIHVAGIQSPGLASAPAIAEIVEDIYLDLFPEVQEREDYNPIRKKPIKFRELSRKEQDAVIKTNPKYGHIICRCEKVTEGEIIDAIHGKIPATTIDAIKRRTRSGMGRCQGGFCMPKVIKILSRELGLAPERVTKRGTGTEILIKNNREG